MNEEKQKIVIAEFCGLNPYRWKFTYQHEDGYDEAYGYESLKEAEKEWKEIYGGPKHADPIVKYVVTPDYLNDLNWIHKVMEMLPWASRRIFEDHLGLIVRRDCVDDIRLILWLYSQATAAQLAEAFLKTINKWED